MSSSTEMKRHRRLSGLVVSAGADKTVKVRIDRLVQHALYGKIIRRSTYILAHDESNACSVGDQVVAEECRPLSKRKSWKVIEHNQKEGA